MKTSIPQILEEFDNAVSKNKVKLLQNYDHPVLRGVLQLNFNPTLKMDLPEGEPPFKKDTSVPKGYSETNLFTEFRRLYIWVDPKVNVTKIRKEQLFIQMLEGLHWTEAELICLAKDKKLQTKYKSLKEDIVREAFPNLLPAKVEVAVKKESSAKKKVSLDAS
jgi:hypothetical protein